MAARFAFYGKLNEVEVYQSWFRCIYLYPEMLMSVDEIGVTDHFVHVTRIAQILVCSK